jgi:hypothetical protein
MDLTLLDDWMVFEEDQPVLTLITTSLFMAMSLLAPAVVEAVRRGCLTAQRYFAMTRLARFEDGEFPGEPSAQCGSDGVSPFPDREEWFS